MVEGGASIRSIDKATQSKQGRDANAQQYLEKQLSQQKKEAYGGPVEDFDARAGSAKGKNQISKYDLRQLEAAGHSREDIVKMAESSDASQNARAQKMLGKWTNKIAKANQPEPEKSTPTPTPTTPTPVAPTPTAPTPTPTPTPHSPSANAGINSPITSTAGDVDSEMTGTIVGDNNMLHQETNIDASSRVYGGSNTVFTYQGGSNPATDTPVSAATMGGFYNVDDSHAANAARLDRQIGQNQDAQKYWQKDAASIAQDTINKAFANTSTNSDAIDERLVNSEQDSFDRAALMGANIFGDMAANGGAPTFKPPQAPKPVEEPDFEDYGQKIIGSF